MWYHSCSVYIISQVLSISCAMVNKNSPTAVLVGVANILSQCGTLKSHDLLKPITICFSLILSHTHSWLSQHYSLDAFRQFAEITPHANILEECIPSAMNNIVVDYLQKVSQLLIDSKDNIYRPSTINR